jgi:hypothetical protein
VYYDQSCAFDYPIREEFVVRYNEGLEEVYFLSTIFYGSRAFARKPEGVADMDV